MPGYTSEEVQGVIDQFLLGAVSMPKTSLGVRDVLSARADVYALLTTTILLRPESYFYVIFLAKNRLEALRRRQQEDLELILSDDTIAALSRRGVPVPNTTELTNAQAALLNINAGINAATGTRTRSLGPEVDRFRRSVSRFVSKALVPAVAGTGTPVETAGETRAMLQEVWATVQERHTAMVALSTAIQDALSSLGAAQLPEKAIQGLVSRLQSRLGELTAELEADSTGATHRTAMLELLTMRTLLSRVAVFRVPQKTLAPVTGDTSVLSGAASAEAASIVGTLSGPFNVPPSSTLELEVGTPTAAVVVNLSNYSNAEAASAELTFSLAFAAGAELRLKVNGTTYPAQSYSLSSYINMAAFLASVQSYLTTNSIPATAYSAGARVYIRSTSAADTSAVELLATTAGQLSFLLSTGFPVLSLCTPVTTESIIADAAGYPEVRLLEQRTDYGNHTGTTAAAGVLELAKASGVLDTSAGGRSFTAPVNLESLGVRARDVIRIGTQVVAVASVFGAAVVVSEDIIAPNIGVSTAYRIGADLTAVPVGTRVLVSSATTTNAGPYRVLSGDVGQLTVDRSFATLADPVTAVVRSSLLEATAAGMTPLDVIAVWPASAGATAVGFTSSATPTHAALAEFDVSGVDLLVRGVSVGDLLTTAGSTAALTAVTASTVTAPGIPYFAGTAAYTIESGRYLAWEDLVAAVTDFIDFDGMRAADFAVSRLLTGAAPVSLLAPGGSIDLYREALLDLSNIQNYEVPFERGIDNILRMLVEQGLDRAADLFTTLQMEEFFGMHPDGGSYATHFTRTASEVTRQVAPQSRFAQSILGRREVRLLSNRRTSG